MWQTCDWCQVPTISDEWTPKSRYAREQIDTWMNTEEFSEQWIYVLSNWPTWLRVKSGILYHATIKSFRVAVFNEHAPCDYKPVGYVVRTAEMQLTIILNSSSWLLLTFRTFAIICKPSVNHKFSHSHKTKIYHTTDIIHCYKILVHKMNCVSAIALNEQNQ